MLKLTRNEVQHGEYERAPWMYWFRYESNWHQCAYGPLRTSYRETWEDYATPLTREEEAAYEAAFAAEFTRYPFAYPDDTKLLAYYATPEHAEAGRLTVCKPGRYLSKFYPKLTPPQISEIVAVWDSEFGDIEVAFATTAEEIREVYSNVAHSCMKNVRVEDYHPAEAYAAGDLAVATIKGKDGVRSARMLVWPAKKVYGSRAYGDESRITKALRKLGYTRGESGQSALAGARMLRIMTDEGILCPYLDDPSRVTDCGDHMILGNYPSKGRVYYAQSTDGVIEETRPEPEAVCDSCSNEFGASGSFTVQGDSVCESCYSDDAFYCEGCNEAYWMRDYGCGTRNGSRCSDCAEGYVQCSNSRCGEATHEDDDCGCETTCDECGGDFPTYHEDECPHCVEASREACSVEFLESLEACPQASEVQLWNQDGTTHTVPGFRFGALAVTPHCDADGEIYNDWNVNHILSGCRVGTYRTLAEAILVAYYANLATDWNVGTYYTAIYSWRGEVSYRMDFTAKGTADRLMGARYWAQELVESMTPEQRHWMASAIGVDTMAAPVLRAEMAQATAVEAWS